MTGIPVSTLRIWELRHHAFSPSKTAGKHRLYSVEDVRRASLLKQLSRQGHAISGIAALQTPELEQLMQPAQALHAAPALRRQPVDTVAVAVVGAGIAGRIGSKKFVQPRPGGSLRLTDSFADLAEANAAVFQERPHLLLVRVSTLHDSIRSEIQALAARQGAAHTLVVYGFAQETVLETMRVAGIQVRREPVSDHELSGLIASLLADKPAGLHGLPVDSPIPPRRYSDETLSRVAGISSSMLCECPRHVAELIAQLASFEQYSEECLSKNEDDANLHAYLHAITGSARALFERALEMVARHENISLADEPGA